MNVSNKVASVIGVFVKIADSEEILNIELNLKDPDVKYSKVREAINDKWEKKNNFNFIILGERIHNREFEKV